MIGNSYFFFFRKYLMKTLDSCSFLHFDRFILKHDKIEILYIFVNLAINIIFVFCNYIKYFHYLLIKLDEISPLLSK